MGCGCGKNRNNKIAAANVSKAAQNRIMSAPNNVPLKSRISVADQEEKRKRRELVEKKLKFCRTCPMSMQTTDERRKHLKICHKSNKTVQMILNDKDFKCPISNF